MTANYGAQISAIATCVQCQQPFEYTGRHISQARKFCSRDCRRAARGCPSERACQHCGKSFTPTGGNARKGKGKFCSHACSVRHRIVPIEEQLSQRVDRSLGPDACWPWTGNRNRDGYGRLSFDSKRLLAHDAVWQQAHGMPIPEGLVVRHLCTGGGNTWCCNPRHLAIGTHQDNSDDKIRTGRQPRGEQCGQAKLDTSQVIAIRERRACGESCASIAADFAVSKSLVSLIGKRSVWGHLQ